MAQRHEDHAHDLRVLDARSGLCLVVSELTSTMACCAIAAHELGVPVAPVGISSRSGDRAMPEEINCRVTDATTNGFFTASEVANGSLLPVDPQPCLALNPLARHAKAGITDAGGVTESATVLGLPCVTLRGSAERPETVMTLGTNGLPGTGPAARRPAQGRL